MANSGRDNERGTKIAFSAYLEGSDTHEQQLELCDLQSHPTCTMTNEPELLPAQQLACEYVGEGCEPINFQDVVVGENGVIVPGLEDVVLEDQYISEVQPQESCASPEPHVDKGEESIAIVNANEDNGNGGNECVDGVVKVPRVGMVFTTCDAIEVLYKMYAKANGFGVTRGQSAYSFDKKQKRAMTWRCECWGDPEMNRNKAQKKVAKQMEIAGSAHVEEVKTRRRKSKKCCCQAMVYASVNVQGMWEIKKVNHEHSGHNPTPRKAKLVKEYRMQYFNNNVKSRVLNGVDVGVPLAKIHCTMARERDGLENMPITEKDMRHVVDERRRLKMEGGDANALFKYFDKMQQDNSQFFHSYRLDETGRLKDVFWADARSRAAYNDFGDVVCFDSTYLTNKYHLPFANFVGVNHHGQSLLLGCALLSHEDCDTFTWVFRQWLQCMGGKPPDGILTDQAQAMRQPLRDVMPKTRHRWCIWHILRKLPHKIGSNEKYLELKEALLEVIYDSFTIQEFEQGWCDVVDMYGVTGHEWLEVLYKERSMWVPAFMKDIFWAGMRTTQRVESINSFFDQFVTRNTRLCEFGEKYIAAVEKRVSQEKDADERGVKYTRNVVTGISLEKFYQRIYTDTKFRSFQQQCERLVYCYVREEREKTQNLYEFLIEDRVWKTCKGGSGEYLTSKRRMYCVVFNSDTKEVECNCKLFETHGVLCRHTIRVLDMNLVEEPPQKYILRRWRKDVARRHSLVKVCYHDHARTVDMKRYDQMYAQFEPLVYEAAVSESRMKLVLRGLKRIKHELDASCVTEGGLQEQCTPPQLLNNFEVVHNNVMSTQCEAATPTSVPSQNSFVHDSAASSIATQSSTPPGVQDPVMPKKKRGRSKSTRYKSPGEKGWKKANCSRAKDCTGQPINKTSGLASDKGVQRAGKLKITKTDHVAGTTSQTLVLPHDAGLEGNGDDLLLSRNNISWG